MEYHSTLVDVLVLPNGHNVVKKTSRWCNPTILANHPTFMYQTNFGHQLIHLTLLVSLQDNMYELLGGLFLPNCIQSPHFREWWRDTHYLSPRDLIYEWIRIVIGRGAHITVDNFRASSGESLYSNSSDTDLAWLSASPVGLTHSFHSERNRARLSEQYFSAAKFS